MKGKEQNHNGDVKQTRQSLLDCRIELGVAEDEKGHTNNGRTADGNIMQLLRNEVGWIKMSIDSKDGLL